VATGCRALATALNEVTPGWACSPKTTFQDNISRLFLPDALLVAQPTVSKQSVELEALLTTSESNPLASSFHHPQLRLSNDASIRTYNDYADTLPSKIE